MSLITSCPQCLTNFRVTQEQLAASNGKVRCGKCQQVFDALSRLGEAPKDRVEEQLVPSPKPADSSPKFVADTAPLEAKLTIPRSKLLFPRWLPRLLIGILLLLAALQSIYYLRTAIAAQWPVLRPALVAACELINCTVGLPQRTELLTIDDSDMQVDAEREGVIHLSATLINNAPFTQAYPLLEITFTDAYDKPVVRRALKADEYLPSTQTQQGIPPGESIQIRLALTAGDEAVAGYRLFVTYPMPHENH
ncbi:MAG TPA: zinc-ribbon and DUF3426 domain-containing protein [Methylophilaceae bacterium]|nr:zinc-ribbon and DUF3426 domain-containing protein [Methylophilaceae bacterium]